MPSSNTGSIEQILNISMELNPNSVIDIGCGFGKYGFLLREYLDICQGNYFKKDWKKIIDAIEIYKPYITEIQKSFYNTIWYSPIESFGSTLLYTYDLFLLLHIIEHLSKKEGIILLKKLVETNIPLLLVTPKTFNKLNSIFGNKYERHLSHWKKKDFRKIGKPQFFRNKNDIIVLFNKKVKWHTKVFKIKNLFWRIFIKKREVQDQ